MRIESTTNNTNVDSVQLNTAARNAEKVPESATAGETTFAPSSFLTNLLNTIRELPEVRTEVVQEVSASLNTAALVSSSASLQAASNIVDQQ